ncbi:hypothetical protein GCM10027398_33730 [Azotobacter salinestris]
MNMANLSKLKNRLGPPPSQAEASQNLTAPEVAPPATPIEPRPRRDGRSARKTHRTIPFATRVSPEFDDRLRDIAERDGLLLVEVLERALDAYEAARSSS